MDAASAVECYMKQHNASKECAFAEFNKQLVCAWKDINAEFLHPTVVPMPLLTIGFNMTSVIHSVSEQRWVHYLRNQDQRNYDPSAGSSHPGLKCLNTDAFRGLYFQMCWKFKKVCEQLLVLL